MAFEIPTGLTELLQEFTVAVLREKPDNLIAFASEYFGELHSKQSGSVLPGLESFKPTKVGFANGDDSDDSDYEMEPPSQASLGRRVSVAAERYDPEADDDDEPKVVHPKTDDQRKRLNDAVKNILLFRSLDIEQMQEVIDAMFERKTEKGECIIKEGDDGDNFYVIDSGIYDILKRQRDGSDVKVGDYKGTGSFGELALMYNQPRAATITGTDSGAIWALDRITFRRIVLKNAFMKRRMYENLISAVPMFNEMMEYERMNLADSLSTKSFEAGQLIIQQGDEAGGMFFVETGEVKVIISTVEDSDNVGSVAVDVDNLAGDEEAEVTRIEQGGYFGELALLTNKPRAASVFAVTATRCAFLDVGAFERLLGPCRELMARNIAEYEKSLEKAFGHKVDINDLR